MSIHRAANQARYLFACGELDKKVFEVERFYGQDRISSPYDFSIELRSDRPDIVSRDVIGKQATLYIFRKGDYYLYSGVCTEFSYLKSTADYSAYNVKLVPKLKLLDYNVQTRVFLKMSIPQIISKVLEDGALFNYFKIDIQGDFPERETVLQYQESDLNFITRLMDEAGLYYFFEEQSLLPEDVGSVHSETLVISNKPSSYRFIDGEPLLCFKTPSSMESKQGTESVNSLVCSNSAVAKRVLVKNYNYRTPEVTLCAGTTVESGTVGTVYHYGKEFSDIQGAEHAAELLRDRMISEISRVNGKSNCAGFRAGSRFELCEHQRGECNDVYLICEVVHRGTNNSVTGCVDATEYSNEFNSVSSDLIGKYKPPVDIRTPKVNGVFTAMIETDGSEYAAIDEMGRYKIRMPFDLSGVPNYNASKYIRLAQPYSGANYGIHFPSHEGGEMILACIDGNPNRPIGLGMVPNASTISPVVNANKTHNVIRTAGKNEILLDDAADKQKIRITTAALNGVVLDDENRRLLLQTTDENSFLIDDCNEASVWKTGSHTVAMSYKSSREEIAITTAKGHVITIDDTNKSISICTEKGHTIQLDDQSGTMVLTDCKQKSSVTLDSQKGLILDSKGEISIKAAKDVSIEGQNVSILSTRGEINVNATRDLSFSGMNIHEKAKMDLAMEGMNTSIKAQVNVGIEAGVATEVKSSVKTTIAGAMTEVSGNGMNTIKGGVVMIN